MLALLSFSFSHTSSYFIHHGVLAHSAHMVAWRSLGWGDWTALDISSHVVVTKNGTRPLSPMRKKLEHKVASALITPINKLLRCFHMDHSNILHVPNLVVAHCNVKDM